MTWCMEDLPGETTCKFKRRDDVIAAIVFSPANVHGGKNLRHDKEDANIGEVPSRAYAMEPMIILVTNDKTIVQHEPSTKSKDIIPWVNCFQGCLVNTQEAFGTELIRFRVVFLHLRHSPA